jgi:hypothetical protein
MQAVVGGNIRYPNLQGIADLFRSSINDTANNTMGYGTGAGNQAGLIMPNSNPDLLNFMSSAVYETFSDLRNIGDPELIVDNYILTGIPPLAQADPTVQVSLAYAGYFNGVSWSNQWTLPIGMSKLIAMWERPSNTGNDFTPMQPAPFGLPGAQQGSNMGFYEMREGQIWMPGCLQQVDLRLRARIGYPMPLSPVSLNFSTAYVPILDSMNAIVSKMRILYAMRFAPDLYQMCVSEEARQMAKLKLEVVRQMQSQENQRAEFGSEATQDFAVSWSCL